jgi:hypothetical protein
MRTQRVVINAKSSHVANVIQRKLTSSGLKLGATVGSARIGHTLDVHPDIKHLLYGIHLDVSEKVVYPTRMVLKELFNSHRHAIHSITIGAQTRISEHVTDQWWNEWLSTEALNGPLLERARGGVPPSADMSS